MGFIPKRSYAYNIRLFVNIMWATRNNDSPASAISLEVEKAFDRGEWFYLFFTLKSFGLLYTHPRAA